MNRRKLKGWVLAFGMASIGISAQAQKLEDGLKAMNYEQYDKAKVILKNVSSPEASFFLGNIYLKQGTLDSAQNYFSKIPGTSPYSSIANGLLAGSNGDAAKAKSSLDQAAPQVGKDYLASVQLGLAYVAIPGNADQNSAAAVAVLNKAAAMKNKNEQVYLALGDAFLKGGKGTEASSSYQQAQNINPNSAEPYASFAALYRFARNATASLDYVSQGIAKDANFGPIYREQAETYRAANKYTDAVTSYEKYLSLTDRSIASRVRYIQFLYLATNYDKANSELADLKTKVKDFNKFPALYRLDAISDYQIGVKSNDKAKLQAGLDAMNQLFAQKSVKPLAIDYAYLGKLQAATGNDSLAIQTLQGAIAQDSTGASDDLYDALSKSYLAKKDYKGVSALYTKRITKGDTSLANYTYGGIYGYYSQLSATKPDTAVLGRADMYLGKVIVKQPTYVTAYYYKGLIHALEDPDAKKGLAQPDFQKIIDMSTSDPKFSAQVQSDPKSKTQLQKAYEYIMYYNFQKKDMTAAKDIATKLLAIDPKNEKAEVVLKQK